MKVIWFIYGDIFATYPNLTIGTAVNGVLTQIPWNTPTEANGQHHASTPNPLGMTTKSGDPGITQSWQDKRVIDFGDYDDQTWAGDDIYIDDVDNPIGDDQDFTVRVIGNDAQSAIMRLNNAQGTNWFSANPNHQFYTNNYGNTDDALNMARLLNGGTNNNSTGIQQNWHARNANPANWKEFVIYKVIMNSQVSRSTSVFISNTTGVGQTLAQRFPNAIEYDANDADHVAAGTLSGPTTTCERTTGDSTTGFQEEATDIGGAYVSGVTAIDVPNDPLNRHQMTKSTPYANVGFHSIFRDDETLTGFKSMNWTDYLAYGDARQDLTAYYNGTSPVWGVPEGDGDQPWPTTNQNMIDLGYSLNMFRMFHGENTGMTVEQWPRSFGSDLNMIIPDPAGGEGAPPAGGSIPDLETPISCTCDAGGNPGGTFPDDFWIRINGQLPQGKDAEQGGFVAILNPGQGFANAQAVIDALPDSIPHADFNLSLAWSDVTLDANGGVATLCLPANTFTCGRSDENGNALRYRLWAIGDNGELHTLETNSEAMTVNHNSNGALINDWTTLFTQTAGVSYAAIEYLGNGWYDDDLEEDLDFQCPM